MVKRRILQAYCLLGFLFMQFSVFGQAKEVRFFERKKEAKTWEEQSVKLSAPFTTDSQKVLAIYTWITENISYDYSSYMSGQPIRFQSPERVFNRKRTTCTGYSNLMVAMLKHIGIAATDVEGFTHDFTLGFDSTKLSSDHAWVAFKADGKWYLADPTWDAGQIGIYSIISTSEVKKSFWKRLKSFRLKNLFRKKKKKTSKTESRVKITYRYGFTRNPSRNYIFIPAEVFLKSHLPNVAHLQLMGSPISMSQYCDSTHSLGDKVYPNVGNFNYSSLNDQFEALERPDKLLWLSDSSLLYHHLNHGDKAINAHNYLGSYYGERTNSIPMLERFISYSDTVLLHSNIGIKLNKNLLAKKRKEFTLAFSEEKTAGNEQLKYMNFIRGHLSRTLEIYRKGKDRILLKEKPTLMKMEGRIYQFTTKATKIDSLTSSNPIVQTGLKRIKELSDSLALFQSKRITSAAELHQMFLALIDSTGKLANNHTDLLYQGQFLNEWSIRHNDKLYSTQLTLVNAFVKDSFNAVLGPRKSWTYLLKLDQEIKKQQVIWTAAEKKDTSINLATTMNYAYSQLMKGVDRENLIQDELIFKAKLLQENLKASINPRVKNTYLDLQDVTKLRTMRQAYLHKMLDNKYRRSIRVHQALLTNVKTWKKNYLERKKKVETA